MDKIIANNEFLYFVIFNRQLLTPSPLNPFWLVFGFFGCFGRARSGGVRKKLRYLLQRKCKNNPRKLPKIKEDECKKLLNTKNCMNLHVNSYYNWSNDWPINQEIAFMGLEHRDVVESTLFTQTGWGWGMVIDFFRKWSLIFLWKTFTITDFREEAPWSSGPICKKISYVP